MILVRLAHLIPSLLSPGGLDKQIQELVEAVVMPMTHKDIFEAIGIKPPKGICCSGGCITIISC